MDQEDKDIFTKDNKDITMTSQSNSFMHPDIFLFMPIYKFTIEIINKENDNDKNTVIIDLPQYHKNLFDNGNGFINDYDTRNIMRYYKKIYEHAINNPDIWKLIDDTELESEGIVKLLKNDTDIISSIDKYKNDVNGITNNIENDIDIRTKLILKQYVIDTINLFFNTYDYIDDRLTEGTLINDSLISMIDDIKWVAYFQKQGGKFGTFDVYNRNCNKIDICYSFKHVNNHVIESDIMKLLLFDHDKDEHFNINMQYTSNYPQYNLDILDHLKVSNDQSNNKRYINLNMVAFGVLNITYDDIKDNPPSDPYLDISLFQQELETYNDIMEDGKNNSNENKKNIKNSVITNFQIVIENMKKLIKKKEEMGENSTGSFPIVYYSDAWDTYNKYSNNKHEMSDKEYKIFEEEITKINMRTPMGTMDVLYNFIHHNSVNYSYTVNHENKKDNNDTKFSKIIS